MIIFKMTHLDEAQIRGGFSALLTMFEKHKPENIQGETPELEDLKNDLADLIDHQKKVEDKYNKIASQLLGKPIRIVKNG